MAQRTLNSYRDINNSKTLTLRCKLIPKWSMAQGVTTFLSSVSVYNSNGLQNCSLQLTTHSQDTNRLLSTR